MLKSKLSAGEGEGEREADGVGISAGSRGSGASLGPAAYSAVSYAMEMRMTLSATIARSRRSRCSRVGATPNKKKSVPLFQAMPGPWYDRQDRKRTC